MERLEKAHLGELILALRPKSSCTFRYSPAASVHAALMRRIELIDPELSEALHQAQQGSRDSYHPWTVSQMKGLVRDQNYLGASPGAQCWVRITALAPRVIEGLVDCFDAEHPLGNEPIYLENVAFDIVSGQSYWANLTTYPSLLTRARPLSGINLSFESPTAFNTQRDNQETPVLTPRRCIESYLNKWNAFSSVAIPHDGLLEYVDQTIDIMETNLRPAWARFRGFSVRGFIGRMSWEGQDRKGNLLRLVNALADFAFYCGTGANVSRGMGHTVRSRR